MPDLGKAYVQIVPSAEGISGSVSNVISGEASSAGTAAGGLLSEGMVSALKVGLAAAGIGAVITAAVGKVGELADFGDAIDKNSQKMGISAQAYQEWDAVLQHSGTSMESMKTSFKTLSNAAQDGNESFERLGISLEDAAAMSTEDLFAAVISGLQDMEAGTERTAIANDLLGRGAVELGALLNTSAEDTQKMRDRVHELGGVLSDEAVKGAAAYKDSLQDMKTAIAGIGFSIFQEFMPGITGIMNGIQEVFSGDTGSGVGMILDGLANIVQGIIEGVPQFLDAGAQLVGGIVQGIVDHLPEMLESGSQAAVQAIDGFLTNLPQMMESGGQALLSLIDGIVNNLPQLVTQAAELVVTIVGTIAEHLPEILAKGVEVVGNIIAGIIQEIPKLPGTALEMINNITNEFSKFDWLKIGSDIIDGIADGISGAADTIIRAAKNAAKEAFEAAKDFLGINSPSTLMRDEVGKYIPAGMAQGILDNADMVDKAMNSLSAQATGTISANVRGNVSAPAAAAGSSNQFNINIYQREGESGEALAQRVAQIINDGVNRRTAVYA